MSRTFFSSLSRRVYDGAPPEVAANGFEIISYDALGPQNWDERIRGFDPSPYHTSKWLDTLARHLPRARNASVALRSPSDTWSFFPAISIRFCGLSKIFSLPYTCGGIVGERSGPAAELISDYIKSQCDSLQVISLENAGIQMNGQIRTFYQVEVDLAGSEESLLSRIHKSTRRDIFQKQDKVRLQQVTTPRQMGFVKSIYKARMRALNSGGTYNDGMLDAVFNLPSSFRRITLAEIEGEASAMSITLLFHRRAEYFANASLPDVHKVQSNKKLLWADILWARQMGASRLNLGGAVDGTREDPLYAYKIRWGKEYESQVRSENLNLKGSLICCIQSAAKSRWIKRFMQ